ncbi:SLC13 family permease [Chloroflexota bacterium]
MELTPLVMLIVFLITIGLIIWGKYDRTVVGLLGVVIMVVLGKIDEWQAFMFVDWNVIAILFSIWIIASYLSETGVPQYLAIAILKLSRNNVAVFLTLIGVIAGLVSMFVDNVVVILMFAPVVFHVTNKLKLPSFPFLIFVGLCANFMGTALLMGDLPPQMLHSVSGIEFTQFIWQMGRPSSFILLTISYLGTVAFMYQFRFRKMFAPADAATVSIIAAENPTAYLKKRSYVAVVLGLFLATIIGMSLRQVIGHQLGFIALIGMVILVLVNEVFIKKLEGPTFEDVLKDLDWRALLFYILLFVLVGGLNHVGIIKMVADGLAPYFQQNLIVGSTILYWVTALIVGIVEHDAYILVFLHLIKDLSITTGFSPWPMWWALVWAGTLGSNLTIAGAPALFCAQSLGEREDGCKIRLKQFLSYSVPFVVISLVIQYVLTMIVWVIPYAR